VLAVASGFVCLGIRFGLRGFIIIMLDFIFAAVLFAEIIIF
jgi:hypothetical protein